MGRMTDVEGLSLLIRKYLKHEQLSHAPEKRNEKDIDPQVDPH